MNRKEFLDTLEKCLKKLPSDEKNDAINYYRELFDEAGKDNEQHIIDDLGNPENIAEQILAENGIAAETDPECLPDVSSAENSYDYTEQNTSGPDIAPEKPEKSNSNNLALIIIILVLTSPLWGGAAAGIIGTVFGIIAAVFAVLFALCVASVAIIGVGVAAMVSGAPPVGLLLLGIGLMMFGASMLVVRPALKGLFRLAVWLVNLLVNAIRNLLNKNRSVQ